jgi:hypothetical protein
VIYTITHRHSKDFSGAIAGEKEDFCKGTFAHASFTLFIVFLLYIYLHLFIKNTKKLVSFIVAFIYLLLVLLE